MPPAEVRVFDQHIRQPARRRVHRDVVVAADQVDVADMNAGGIGEHQARGVCALVGAAGLPAADRPQPREVDGCPIAVHAVPAAAGQADALHRRVVDADARHGQVVALEVDQHRPVCPQLVLRPQMPPRRPSAVDRAAP